MYQQSQLLPLLFPGGQRQYHLGSACGKSWDERPGNETIGIRNLGMRIWQKLALEAWDQRWVFKKLGSEAETGIGGLGMRLCQNWNWKSGNEAMSGTSQTDKIYCRIFPKQNEK